MTREEFLSVVKADTPSTLARSFLLANQVAAFPAKEDYTAFRVRVSTIVGNVEMVHLAGSGNWGYSLHPEKAFKAFDQNSDLDVAVISNQQFNWLWDDMRAIERKHWYRLTQYERLALKRNAENVYSGFVSPLWLPDRTATRRVAFQRIFNQLSDEEVGYRSVKAFIFKNLDEAVAYYERGFAKARKALQ